MMVRYVYAWQSSVVTDHLIEAARTGPGIREGSAECCVTTFSVFQSGLLVGARAKPARPTSGQCEHGRSGSAPRSPSAK